MSRHTQRADGEGVDLPRRSQLSQSESEAGTHGRNSQDAPVRFGATLDLHESTHSPLPARPPATSPQDAPATAPGRLSLELRAQEARASEVVQRRSMSSGPPVQAETAGESLGVWTAEGRRGSEWYCLERTASSIFRGGDSGASRGEDRGGGEAETSPRGGAERDTRGPSLLRVLMGAARGELVALSAIKVGNDLLGFVGAFLLHQIVSCLETSRSPKRESFGSSDKQIGGKTLSSSRHVCVHAVRGMSGSGTPGCRSDSVRGHHTLLSSPSLHRRVRLFADWRCPPSAADRGLGDVPPAEVDSSPLKVGLTYAALLAATAAAQAFISTRLVYRTGLLQVRMPE